MSQPSLIIGVPKPKPAAEIIPAQRCGNCWFHADLPGNPTMVMCQGGPPTACVMGIQQTPLGPQPAMNSFWPQLMRNQRRCALWADQGEDIGGVSQ